MAIVSVIYPNEQGATFDFDYYRNTHLPLVDKRWGDAGLKSTKVVRGVAAADGGPPPFLAITMLEFGSAEEFKAAIGGEHAPEVLGDIANFTSVHPVVQLNDQL